MDWNRISRLVPMLSSDKQGEVIAAVNAIGRVLVAGGGNWHDLAKRVDGGFPGAAYGREEGETKRHSQTKQQYRPATKVRTFEEALDRLKYQDLSKWEREFCDSMRKRFAVSPHISMKQQDVLEKIMKKCGIEFED